jgi:hypothetical protein
MIKSNPFYALSASAMLLGCWLLSEALELQAGQLQGLLVLMFVLQLYEGLLVGFGAFLVRSKRAPRDGLVVLVIESLFLLDATLLATECVTTDTAVGTFVAVTSAALAVLKLWWVRRAAPDLLTQKAAVILGAHAALILAAPVAAAHLAGARRNAGQLELDLDAERPCSAAPVDPRLHPHPGLHARVPRALPVGPRRDRD